LTHFSHPNPFFFAGSDAYALPLWRQLLWGFFFVAMAGVAAFGNLVVIWIVVSQKRMRNVTNYFIGE